MFFVVLSLVLGVVAGIYTASSDNISNRIDNNQNYVFKSDNMVFDGWQKNETNYVSTTETPSITLLNIDDYVNNIYFNGTLQEYEGATVKIFYTTEANENFTEEKIFLSLVELKGQNLYFSLDKNVNDIRIQLYDKVGLTSKINSFEINPRYINFSFSIIFSYITVLLMIIIVFCLFIYRNSFKSYYDVFKKYKSLLTNLIERDLKVKYRRSVLGLLWSILNPLLMMLVITAVFANVFKFDIKDFPVYYITGAWIFNFVSEATTLSLTSIIGAAPLIKKVYIPKYIFPLQKCLYSFVNMLFTLIAVAIVFLILQIQIHWTVLLFPIPMIYAFVFSLGLSLILSSVNVFFRDVGHLYSVWITAWMYFTPIIYPISALPSVMISILKLNPLYYYVEYARDILIYGNIPSLQQNIICIGFALITLILGLLLFKKTQDKFILYI